MASETDLDRADAVFEWVLGAAPSESAPLRTAFRAWLRAMDWPDGRLDELEADLDRAVLGVVEHAYPAGTPDPHREVRVCARHTVGTNGRRVLVEVTDSGRWRPVPADPGVLFVGWFHAESA